MECIDFTKNSVKVLSIHFSYNKKMENKDNFIKVYANKADTSASFFVNISMYAYIFPLKVYIYIYSESVLNLL